MEQKFESINPPHLDQTKSSPSVKGYKIKIPGIFIPSLGKLIIFFILGAPLIRSLLVYILFPRHISLDLPFEFHLLNNYFYFISRIWALPLNPIFWFVHNEKDYLIGRILILVALLGIHFVIANFLFNLWKKLFSYFKERARLAEKITTWGILLLFAIFGIILPLVNHKLSANLVEIGKKYDMAYHPIEVAGKLAYYAKQGKEEFVVYDGQEIGKEYTNIMDFSLMDIGGKLAFIAYRENWKSPVVYWGGEELGGTYDHISYLTNLNDFPVFLASNDQAQFKFIVYNTEEVTKIDRNQRIESLKEINHKIAYKIESLRTQADGFGFYEGYIVYDGQEIGKEYRNVEDFIDVNGKLCYIARRTDNKRIVVCDGEESKPYDFIVGLREVNNKPAFRASNEEKGVLIPRKFIVYDGQEIGKEYDSIEISAPVEIAGKLAFGIDGAIVYDGKKIGKQYTLIFDPLNVNGKLTFVADKKDLASYLDKRIVYYGGEEFGEDYDSVVDPTYTSGSPNPVGVGGKLCFTVEKVKKVFILMEK
ncbi:MAG: hypothetical protein A2295_01340 [Candidatus Jacksonbacteria bacterium RIFOXYB2_FULL_44_15]|nr:MAG: hypothetical protein UV19_C0003G0005 [Parcubacteria group bacterium GW2011_GWA2_42_28]KKT55824.1 MAG: hypothetical protein UW45_C0004G0005 [Parcubacteria group bacterium GW2011_GWC2_44_22]OGY75604.1 MAG: hypothetical protein A2240_03600 [Candidatus Jacksonbacteria bacterium RIFOXYA2_FULL_43_12]OGY76578.1 MAG: hypothetical protein A2295_01340 [Candidatus Jacksonbacteria bacterium RIFOXYB2_FULL_44_15]OGY81506.1 MAG: hypothetical protein A2550_00695 [Candidatus Jacksonbacteria bacterium RI